MIAETPVSRKKKNAMQKEPEQQPDDQDQAAQIQGEAARAAIRFFELNPAKPNRVVIRQEAITAEDRQDAERATATHKFYVVLGRRAQYAARVYRQGPGRYLVEEAEDEGEAAESQDQEAEAYQVLMTAARYLEINIRTARQVEATEEQPEQGAAYSARWKLEIDGQACQVARYDHPSGPEYAIIEP